MPKYKFDLPSDCPRYFRNFSEHLAQFLENIEGKVEEVKIEFEELKTSFKKDIERVETKAKNAMELAESNKTAIDSLKKDLFGMQRKCEGLQTENERLENKCDALDSYGRRENIVIRGIPERQGEDEAQCITSVRDFFVNQLKLERNVVEKMVFQRCHRLGTSDGNTKFRRPVIVRFLDYNDRQLVWSKRFDLNDKTVSLSENFANNVDYRRRLLYPVLRKAKASGRYGKVMLKADTLKLDDKEYRIGDNEDELPEDLQLKQFSIKQIDDWLVFGGIHSKYNFLSNYYSDQVTYKGTTHASVEHAYQFTKAEQYNNKHASRKILCALSPGDAKQLGSNFAGFDRKDWDNRKRAIMTDILRCKFAPNSEMAAKLKATTGKSLAEAGRSRSFAIGVTLNSRVITDTSKWNTTSGNLLGKCLMCVRDEL